MNRVTAAIGLPLGALSLTFCGNLLGKVARVSLVLHHVWRVFFANCVRGALSVGIILMLWLLARGDYQGGVYNKNQLHCISTLAFAFTVFWAYVTFSQYFLIWNANVPEETFWYNLREVNHDGTTNQWWYVGLVILFGHFFLPFLYMLSYKHKTTPKHIIRVAYWILAIILVDMCYNILPALKDEHGDSLPMLSMTLVWVLTSVVGIGGICAWAYLKSFPTTKLIPIRDPRIRECLTHHE